MAIRPLDPLLIGKIAAGEVVERPAFAIKELVENCIDAGATAITVDIREGGLAYFRVTDNGCGIAPEDVRMAFARHATSKLRTQEELFAIHTLGFRGEALHSIGAVAKVEMTTRTAGRESGIKAIVSGGVMESIRDAASPEGTTITVRDLFYNVPARRKFLKKPATETGLISDLVMRMILARPDISFRLTHGERTIYHSPGNGNLRDALFCTLGKEAIKDLKEVKGSAAGFVVSGYVGVGEAARSNKAMQTFILNGRYVKSTFLSQALEEGCHERVMVGKYPVCALHLTMPFEAVDVNVHPNKLEVRFRDERAVMGGLASIIKKALMETPLTAAPAIPLDVPKTEMPPKEQPLQERESIAIDISGLAGIKPMNLPYRPATVVRDSGNMNMPPPMKDRPSVPRDISRETLEQIPMVQTEKVEDVEKTETKVEGPLPRVMGVAFLEYVFCEQGETLYIIDQHAAHERILFERYQKALAMENAAQQLLVPHVVELTHREHAALMENQEALTAAGFELQDFGDRTIQVRALPMILGAPDIRPFLSDLAENLSVYRTLPTVEKRRDLLVKLACRKAVKAGDALPLEAVEGLIYEMQSSGLPPTCPHGRPLVVRIDKGELDKRFRRI